MHKLTGVICTLGLAMSCPLRAPAQAQDAPPAPRPASVIVLPFAVEGAAPSTADSLPGRACSLPEGAPALTDAELSALGRAARSGLQAKLTGALSQALRDQGGLSVYNDFQAAPPGALIIAGCIVRADPGDPAKRVVGMGMGASVLSGQVQLYRGDQARPEPVGEFTLDVKGTNRLPPIGVVGLAVHGVRERHETLTADVGKLAKLIAKRIHDGQLSQ